MNRQLRARIIGQILVLGRSEKCLRVQDKVIVRVGPTQKLGAQSLDVTSLSCIELLWVALALPFGFALVLLFFGVAPWLMVLTLIVGVAIGAFVLIGLATVFLTIQFWREPIEKILSEFDIMWADCGPDRIRE